MQAMQCTALYIIVCSSAGGLATGRTTRTTATWTRTSHGIPYVRLLSSPALASHLQLQLYISSCIACPSIIYDYTAPRASVQEPGQRRPDAALQAALPYARLPILPGQQEPRQVRLPLPPGQRPLPAQREQTSAHLHGVLARHGRTPSWPRLPHGPSADAQALPGPLLGFCHVARLRHLPASSRTQ
jgi:hypothetical protein